MVPFDLLAAADRHVSRGNGRFGRISGQIATLGMKWKRLANSFYFCFNFKATTEISSGDKRDWQRRNERIYYSDKRLSSWARQIMTILGWRDGRRDGFVKGKGSADEMM